MVVRMWGWLTLALPGDHNADAWWSSTAWHMLCMGNKWLLVIILLNLVTGGITT